MSPVGPDPGDVVCLACRAPPASDPTPKATPGQTATPVITDPDPEATPAPVAPKQTNKACLEVDEDAYPFLARSVSAVDSGFSGQEEDPDEDNVDSSNSDNYSTNSEDDGEVQCAAKDAVHQVMQDGQTLAGQLLTSPVAFQGDIRVTKSNHIQFGNNTHIHGPVTVVVSEKKTINGVPLPAAPPSMGYDGDLGAAKAVEGASPFSLSPSPVAFAAVGPAKDKDKKVLLAGLLDGRPLWTRRGVQIACVACVVTVMVAVAICVHTLRGLDSGAGIEPVPLPNGLTIVDRRGWLAQPPNGPINKLVKQPVDYVIMHHSATDPCFSYTECLKTTRQIQMFHVESNKWSDIGYNFLVGGDGYVYEGRGWDQEGAHTFNWNKRSLGICLIGTFTYQRPTMEQLRTTLKLIEYGIQLKKITAEYKLAGVCQLRSTESPGRLVQQEIQSWRGWWNYTLGESNCR